MTLLVGYRPSRAGDAALDAAVHRAEEADADLAVAYVVPEEVSRSCCSISTGRWKEILEEDARAALSRARARVDGARHADYVVVRGRPAEALAAPVKTYRGRGRPRWLFLGAASVLAAGALALAVVPGGADVPPPGAPVTQAEVERLANSFADAYAQGDEARISRLLTPERAAGEPVGPPGRQGGGPGPRTRAQFAAEPDQELRSLRAAGVGRLAGRATAHYETGATTGTMTWNVIRDHGKPRISQIALVPD